MKATIELTVKDAEEIIRDHFIGMGYKVSGVSFIVTDGNRGGHNYCGPHLDSIKVKVDSLEKS